MRPSAKTAPLFLSHGDADDPDFERCLREAGFEFHDPGYRWEFRRKPDASEVIEPEIEEPPSRRKRKPNITTLIKRARKAGERGPVRVELVNDDGSRTIVTSSSEATPEAMSEADAEKLWHERISKNAAH